MYITERLITANNKKTKKDVFDETLMPPNHPSFEKHDPDPDI